jgi:hypothetical protein
MEFGIFYFREINSVSIRTCLKIVLAVVISCSYRSILLVVGTSVPLLSDLQSRINNIFIQDTASYLVYVTEGVVRA